MRSTASVYGFILLTDPAQRIRSTSDWSSAVISAHLEPVGNKEHDCVRSFHIADANHD
jgi:hypothetical protein